MDAAADNAVTDHLYDFLYAWHVPAFVFVTGYLSRTFVYSKVRLWQLVRTVVVPYVLFECALALFRVYVGGEELEEPLPGPALADVVPRRAVLLAAAHPDLPADVGRPRRRGRDQPGRRACTPATPSTWPGSSACCRSS